MKSDTVLLVHYRIGRCGRRRKKGKKVETESSTEGRIGTRTCAYASRIVEVHVAKVNFTTRWNANVSVCLSVSLMRWGGTRWSLARWDEVKLGEVRWGKVSGKPKLKRVKRVKWPSASWASRWEDARSFILNYKTQRYRRIAFDNQWKNWRKEKRTRGKVNCIRGDKEYSGKSANDDDARSFRGHASTIRQAMMRSTVSSIGCWPQQCYDVFVTCVWLIGNNSPIR